MNSTSFARTLAAGLALALFAACSPQSPETAQRFARPEAYWPERSVVFLADAQPGVVRAIGVKNGIVPLGQIVTPDHAAVLALSFDAPGKRLWVLDRGALYAHDAANLRLLHRWAAPGGVELQALDRDADGAILAVAADGLRYRADPDAVALKPAYPARRLAASQGRTQHAGT